MTDEPIELYRTISGGRDITNLQVAVLRLSSGIHSNASTIAEREIYETVGGIWEPDDVWWLVRLTIPHLQQPDDIQELLFTRGRFNRQRSRRATWISNRSLTRKPSV